MTVPSKPKILIVDDTPANLIALNALLKKVDAEVIKANSGNEALSLVLENDFALFLLDVQMPGMDGYELADILLGEYKTKEIPIIFITAALRDETHRLKGYSHGAIDYIEKPINENILLAKVRILLKIWKKNHELSLAFEEIAKKNNELQAEIAERKRMQDQLDRMAMYDALTNLPNRLLLKKEATKLISAAKRYHHQVAFMFLDLDGFKAINDNNGHNAGDIVLIEMALHMQEVVRDIDTVARFGGDEFIIVLPDCNAKPGIESVAKRVINAINKPLESVKINQKLGVSIGISIYPDDADNCDTLIDLADKAMYAAKNSGRNKYKFYSS